MMRFFSCARGSRTIQASEFPAQGEDTWASRTALAAEVSKTKAGMVIVAAATKERPTHQKGVTGRGTAVVKLDPGVPPAKFLKPGARFPVRVRHSNAIGYFDHDGGAEPRGMAVKFSDALVESPWDLFLNSGETAGFFNMESFSSFMSMQISADDASHRAWIKSHPSAAVNPGYRRAPDSYAALHYYSQTTFAFHADDGLKRYCRFRTVPLGPSGEEIADTGILTDEDLDQFRLIHNRTWCGPTEEDAARLEKDYLRKDYAQRLESGKVRYSLQMQSQAWQDGVTTAEIFNPNRPWDRASFPYLGIMEIEVLSVLQPVDAEKTCCWLGRLPPCFSIIPATSLQDYNSINVCRARVHKSAQWARATAALPELKDGVSYTIVAHTGSLPGSETDAEIRVMLEGTRGYTRSIKLESSSWSSMFGSSFKCGSEEACVVDAEDVGQLIAVHVEHDGLGFASAWFCNRIAVFRTKHPEDVTSFACYGWIDGDTRVVFPSSAGLARSEPEGDEEKRGKARSEYLARMRQLYPWNDDETLPLRADIDALELLPLDEQWKPGRERFMSKNEWDAVLRIGMSELAESVSEILHGHVREVADMTQKMGAPRDFGELLVGCLKPKVDVENRWDSDLEFADAFLNSCSAEGIAQVRALPEAMCVTAEELAPVLERLGFASLDTALAAGAVYHIDCSLLEGVRTWQGSAEDPNMKDPRFVAPAQALFVVDAAEPRRLWPAAIQLERGEGSDVWIAPPPHDKDAGADPEWLTAKAYFASADAQIHQMITHLLRTHLVMEPFKVSMLRNLPPCHPVYKLLHHHFHETMAINTHGRAVLIPPGGIADLCMSTGGGGHMDIMTKFYHERLHWRQHIIFPGRFEARSTTSKQELPHYHYRDDGLEIWDAIGTFVLQVLGLHYASDADVQADGEVQEWIAEVHVALSKARGFPERFSTVGELAEAVQAVIFQQSCGHSAANFSQLDRYAFVPNCPLSLMLAPPKKGEASMERLMAALPNRMVTIQQMAAGSILSTMDDGALDARLGVYRAKIFSVAETEAVESFQADVERISQHIDRRMASEVCVSGDHYRYLNPANVPNSISI